MKTAKFRELQEHHEKTICCDSDTKYMQIARTERDQFTPFFCHDDGEFGAYYTRCNQVQSLQISLTANFLQVGNGN